MMKRRVFRTPTDLPAGAEVMATFDTVGGHFHVGVRPDQWGTWSPPLEVIRVDDDPVSSEPALRVRGGMAAGEEIELDPVEVSVVANAIGYVLAGGSGEQVMVSGDDAVRAHTAAIAALRHLATLRRTRGLSDVQGTSPATDDGIRGAVADPAWYGNPDHAAAEVVEPPPGESAES